jgi:hypothetical protein
MEHPNRQMDKLKGYRKLEKRAHEDRLAGMISASEASPEDYRTGRVSEAMTSLENIQIKQFKRGRGGYQGYEHTEESRRKISTAVKDRLAEPRIFEKMWRARRARQFREKGKCLLRFPRLGVSSTEKEWLDGYRKRYRKITGKRLGRSAIVYYPDKPELWAAHHSTIS